MSIIEALHLYGQDVLPEKMRSDFEENSKKSLNERIISLAEKLDLAMSESCEVSR